MSAHLKAIVEKAGKEPEPFQYYNRQASQHNLDLLLKVKNPVPEVIEVMNNLKWTVSQTPQIAKDLGINGAAKEKSRTTSGK